MKKLNKKGFSLVELIIVIAIMAVLIGLLAPQYLKYVERSRIQKTISDASTVCNAIIAMLTDSAAQGDDLYQAIERTVGESANGSFSINLMNPQDDDEVKIADAINNTAGGALDGTVTFYINADYTPSFSYVLNDGNDKYAVDYQVPDGHKHNYVMVDGAYGAYLKGEAPIPATGATPEGGADEPF